MTAICNRDCFQCAFDDCILPEEDVSHSEASAADRRDRIARLISPQSYPRKPYKPRRSSSRKPYQTSKPAISHDKQEYYRKNRDTILAKKREYYRKNRDVILEKDAVYYEKNREQILEKHAEWKAKNRESIKAYNHEYYLAHKKAPCRCYNTDKANEIAMHKIAPLCGL